MCLRDRMTRSAPVVDVVGRAFEEGCGHHVRSFISEAFERKRVPARLLLEILYSGSFEEFVHQRAFTRRHSRRGHVQHRLARKSAPSECIKASVHIGDQLPRFLWLSQCRACAQHFFANLRQCLRKPDLHNGNAGLFHEIGDIVAPSICTHDKIGLKHQHICRSRTDSRDARGLGAHIGIALFSIGGEGEDILTIRELQHILVRAIIEADDPPRRAGLSLPSLRTGQERKASCRREDRPNDHQRRYRTPPNTARPG